MSDRIADAAPIAPGAGIQLESYLSAAWRHRWLIVGLTVAGVVAGLALALMRPPMYEARASVVISRPTASADTPPSIANQAIRTFFTNQSVAAQALSETGLDRPPHSLDAARFVRDNVLLDDIVPGSMLQVRVRLSDPLLATKMCSRLVELAIALNARISGEESEAGLEFVRQQLDSSRQKLDELEEQLLTFKTRAQVDVQREDMRALLDGRRELVDLEMRLAAERGRLIAAESELAKRSKARPSGRALDSPGSTEGAPGSAHSREGAIVSDRTHLEQRRQPSEIDSPSAPADPVVESLDYEAASSRVRLAGLESRRKELVGTLGVTRPNLKLLTELYKREMEQARLQAEYDISAKVYQDLLTKYEQVRVRVGSNTGMKLIDPAIAASSVATPLAGIAATLGGAAALGTGILLAFALEFFRAGRQRDPGAVSPS